LNANNILWVDPIDCIGWPFANRHPEYLKLDACADLIESIDKIGQQVPALVRERSGSPKYEIISGMKRLFACKHLGKKIKIEVTPLADKQALLAMDAENRQRSDISPYERACDYKRWVKSGIYKNYTEIINDLGVKKSWFSQLVSLADLSPDIVKAFGHPNNLKIKWGYELQLLCKKSLLLEQEMIKLAKDIKGNFAPSQVYNKLKNPQNKDINSIVSKPLSIMDANNSKIFEVKYTKQGKPQLFFFRKLHGRVIDKIIEQARKIIENEQVIE